jgi:hypothetical protein
MTDSYYDMPSEQIGGLEDSSIDTVYLRSLLEKQKNLSASTQTPLGSLQLGGWNNNQVRLIVKNNEVQVDLNGNTFPEIYKNASMTGGGDIGENSLLEHAKHFHNLQDNQIEQSGGSYLEDSYFKDTETPSAIEDSANTRKMKLFDYVDTIGDY